MNSDELAGLARTVAKKVRAQIPRSANRQLADEGEHSVWLQSKIPAHIDLLHKLVRTASARDEHTGADSKIGRPLENIGRQRKVKFIGIPVKTKYDPVTVRDLKRVVLEFIDTKGIDLRYRSREEEAAYCEEFGNALAEFLNQKGLRKLGANDGRAAEWTGARVLNNLSSAILEHQRLFKYNVDTSAFGKPDSDLELPMEYIVGNARGALKFHVGNCEEVASVAYVMLTQGKTVHGERLGQDDEPIPVELAYIKTSDGAAHFFVVLNRKMDGYIDETKDQWIADDDLIICDPWISDEGLGGRITDGNASMKELVDWIRDSTVCVRATGNLGQGSAHIKESDQSRFYI